MLNYYTDGGPSCLSSSLMLILLSEISPHWDPGKDLNQHRTTPVMIF
jgi:hypothetical protein